MSAEACVCTPPVCHHSAQLVGGLLSGEGMGWGAGMTEICFGPDSSHRKAVLTSGRCSTSKCVGRSNRWSGGRRSPSGATQGLLWKASLNWERLCAGGCRFSVNAQLSVWVEFKSRSSGYSGGSVVPRVHYICKYPHGVITYRAKSAKGNVSAVVIKELLKNQAPFTNCYERCCCPGQGKEAQQLGHGGNAAAASGPHLSNTLVREGGAEEICGCF